MALYAKDAGTYSTTAVLCIIAKFYIEDWLFVRSGRGLKEHITAALRPRSSWHHRVLSTACANSCITPQPKRKRPKIVPEAEFDIFRHFYDDNSVGGDWRFHGVQAASSSANL